MSHMDSLEPATENQYTRSEGFRFLINVVLSMLTPGHARSGGHLEEERQRNLERDVQRSQSVSQQPGHAQHGTIHLNAACAGRGL